MPPKRVQKEDTRGNGSSAQHEKHVAEDIPREARNKRGAHYRDYQEDANGTMIPLFEVDALDQTALHKYRKVHRLALPPHLDSFAMPLAQSGTATPSNAASAFGSQDMSMPAMANQMPANAKSPLVPPNRYTRVEKEEALLAAVKRHWSTQQIKENDAIVSFLYSVQNQDRSFKMRFNTGG